MIPILCASHITASISNRAKPFEQNRTVGTDAPTPPSADGIHCSGIRRDSSIPKPDYRIDALLAAIRAHRIVGRAEHSRTKDTTVYAVWPPTSEPPTPSARLRSPPLPPRPLQSRRALDSLAPPAWRGQRCRTADGSQTQKRSRKTGMDMAEPPAPKTTTTTRRGRSVVIPIWMVSQMHHERESERVG